MSSIIEIAYCGGVSYTMLLEKTGQIATALFWSESETRLVRKRRGELTQDEARLREYKRRIHRTLSHSIQKVKRMFKTLRKSKSFNLKSDCCYDVGCKVCFHRASERQHARLCRVGHGQFASGGNRSANPPAIVMRPGVGGSLTRQSRFQVIRYVAG